MRKILLIVTNFIGGTPRRCYLDPMAIIGIEAFGSGRDSGTEVLMSNGEVIETSVWDTEWPMILARLIPEAIAASPDQPVLVVEFDRRDEHQRDLLNIDRKERWNIDPYQPDTEGKTREQRRSSRRRVSRGRNGADTDSRYAPDSPSRAVSDYESDREHGHEAGEEAVN